MKNIKYNIINKTKEDKLNFNKKLLELILNIENNRCYDK